MTQTVRGSDIRSAGRARDASALFVVLREERGATDARFIGEFSAAAAKPLPDVLRQIMRRGPTFLHLDLRQVTSMDEEGVKALVHAVRICRRHGAMVKISQSAPVAAAIDASGSHSSLGILPERVQKDLSDSADGDGSNGSRGPSPRF